MKGDQRKVLIIAGGGIEHLTPFVSEGKKLGVQIMTASFSDLEYLTKGKTFVLGVEGKDIAFFDVVYIRLVGKRFEDAALLASYAKEKRVKIVDKIYEKSQYIRLPLAKSLEAKLLSQANIPHPETLFANLSIIEEKAPKVFGFPLVIKGTVGKQGHAVWSPRNEKELRVISRELKEREKKGERFLAQEFIRASQRSRVLVIGGQAVAAITRPTRWRKRFIKKVKGDYPLGKRGALMPVPKNDAELAVLAAEALDIDIGGVDIIREDTTGEAFVLEVNSAPRWEAIRADTKVNVEREIVKFLLHNEKVQE